MNSRLFSSSALTCVAIAILWNGIATSAQADNWPQWRGPKWDNVSTEQGLPDRISGENQLWRVDLPGPGGASPIVWEDAVFVTSVGADDELFLIRFCGVRRSGSKNWKARIARSEWTTPIQPAHRRSPTESMCGP